MPTEKLLRAELDGPEALLEPALRRLVLDRPFHLLSPAEAARAGEADPYREPLDRMTALLGNLHIRPQGVSFDPEAGTPEAAESRLAAAEARYAALAEQKRAAEAARAAADESAAALSPFSELDADLAEILAVRRLDVRFLSVPADAWPDAAAAAAALSGTFLFRTGEENGAVRGLCLSLPAAAAEAEEALSGAGAVFLDRPAETLSGVPRTRIPELRAQSEAARAQALSADAALSALSGELRDALLADFCWLRFRSEACGLRSWARLENGRFRLSGWVPEKEAETFRADAQALGCGFSARKPGLTELGRAPVRLTEGFFTRIFAPFLKMYGYPAYGELDPRIFMTVTFSLLFGIMFGDVGQGAVLSLFGLWLAKKKGASLGRIMACVGVSSVIFGFVYGSVFGNETLLPGFKVMEDGNMMTMLIVTVVLGAALIAACGVLNIVTGFRQRDLKKALFSANGVCGLVFYLGLAAALAGKLMLGFNLFGSPLYLIFGLALPLLGLFCGGPLAALCEGRKKWLPENWGMFFIDGFFGLFESCLSWFSNTVSFLRVGAYAICHAGMMMVVYLLAGKAIWGLVLGNALVMVVEAVLVCIQVLRLEYYEMFGRFYSGQGTPFVTRTVDYAAARA